MKYIYVSTLLLLSVFLSSCEQNQTGLAKDNSKSGTKDSTTFRKYMDSLAQDTLLIREISKEKTAGTIYQSASRYHNVVHAFTYLVAMRDHCSKSLLQMRTKAEDNKKLFDKLESELLYATAKLTSPIFNGLKVETGLYEKFLKQINDRFRDKC
ncbi:MAG: hypothetical protein JWM28_1859 [Chitinophagaceae bacterium]|nr:hypothetical protein [Chitinophagaceae bacterium]